MDESAGFGDDIGALACTFTDCAFSSATTMVTGAKSDRTGASGSTTITTSQTDGPGAEIAESDATCTACASSGDGLVQSGWSFDDSGNCTAAIITTTASMVAPSGVGAGIDALVCTCTADGSSTVIIRVIGGMCDPTGICGVVIIITNGLGGSGVSSDGLGVICIACAFTSAGLEQSGYACVLTGICTNATVTTIGFMVELDGRGVVTGASESTCTATGPSTATIKGIGAVCGPTGICGGATTTIGQTAGSGDDTVASADISTVYASSSDGMVVAGFVSEHTGIFIVGTTTTTDSTDVSSGGGANIAVLVSTCIAFESCTETTKVIGARCVRTGICGGATTITKLRNGAGADIVVLAAICIVCVSSGAGLVRAGLRCAAIGACTGATTTITDSTDVLGGLGEGTSALAFICTVIAHIGAITKATGVASGLTGICGSAITITSLHVGRGAGQNALAVTCTVCEF